MLGSGFREESIDRALELGVRMIGCDAGTTDFGPHLLATGKSQFSRAAVKRDTSIMLGAAVQAGNPLVIRAAGRAGGGPQPPAESGHLDRDAHPHARRLPVP